MHCLPHLPITLVACVLAGTPAFAATVFENDVFKCTFLDEGDKSGEWSNSLTGTANWTSVQQQSAMRAMATISNMMQNTPGRKVEVGFIFCSSSSISNAVMDTIPYLTTAPVHTKSMWDASDFGGKYTGGAAHVNNLEDVWKYGSTIKVADKFDVLVRVSDSRLDNFHYSDAQGEIESKLDFESLVLHEMGHPLGFYSVDGYTGTNPKTAFEQLTVGGKYQDLIPAAYFTGDLTMAYLAEKGSDVVTAAASSDYNNYGLAALGVMLETVAFSDGMLTSHIDENTGYADITMGAQAIAGEKRREFSELELYMLADMGWSVKSIVIPEPSLFGVLAGTFALAFAGTRRRRAK